LIRFIDFLLFVLKMLTDEHGKHRLVEKDINKPDKEYQMKKGFAFCGLIGLIIII